jgi:hypothetical protein
MATRTPRQVKRIAPPRVIADAERTLYGRYEHLDEPLRTLKYNAVRKAGNQLFDGIRIDLDIEQREVVFPSRSRTGITHSVTVDINGEHTCTCEAFAEQEQPCWHIEATNIALAILDTQRPRVEPEPQPEPEPPDIHAQLIQALREAREEERQLNGENTLEITIGQVRQATTAQLRLWLAETQRQVKRAKQARQRRAHAALEECYP